jgi:biopolymer transport protein ExbD
VTLDRDEVTLEQLSDRLARARQEYPDIGVIVRGDGNGRFQNVAEVLNACKQAGISELAISVRLTEQRR